MKTFLAKYTIDIYLIFVSFLFLLLLSFVVSWIIDFCWYWEGLGHLPRGSWFLFLGLSFVAGIPFCIIFIIRMILRSRKDRAFISTIRLLLGLSFLISPALINTAGSVLAAHFSDEPGCVKFSKGFRDRIESKCSIEEVRTWAQELLNNREKSVDEYGIYLKKVPPFITKIDLQNEIAQHMHVSVVNGIIDLCCGGSPLTGHFGILIGPSDFVREEGFIMDGQQIYYLKWKPGIYVWYSEN